MERSPTITSRIARCLSGLLPYRVAAFAVVAAVFIHSQVQTPLVYLYEPRVFWLRADFLLLHLGACGGLCQYLGAWLFQYLHFGWSGGLVWGLAIWLTSVGAIRVAAAFGQAAGRSVPCGTWVLPAAGLFLLACRYAQDLATPVGLLLALAAALGWLRTAHWGDFARLATFAALAATLYYLAGGAVGIFVACGLVELLARRRWVSAGIALVLGAAAVAALEAAFRPTMGELRLHLLPIVTYEPPLNLGLAIGLWAYWPAMLIVLAAREAIARRWRERQARATNGRLPIRRRSPVEAPIIPGSQGPGAHVASGVASPSPAGRDFLWAQFHVLLLAAVLLPLGCLAIDRELRSVLQVEQWSSQGRWADILQVAPSLPAKRYDYALEWDVNRALYETGRLPYEMFRYPQRYVLLPRILLVSKWRDLRRMFDLCLRLGRVNDAECIAHESWVLIGEKPQVFRALATVKMVKGRMAAARECLNMLCDDMVEGPWARQCLERIAADPTLERDDEIQALRRRRLRQDDVILLYTEGAQQDPSALLEPLLTQDPSHRMAFEYMVAQYLAAGRLDAVAGAMKWLDQMNYPDIPIHFEEALLLNRRQGGKSPMLKRPIRPQTLRMFERFAKAMERWDLKVPEQKAQAQAALKEEFGKTYCYYFVFGGGAP